ncbi:hypothetical protein OGZ09_22485, partial [Escherichia albertii]|nr:hypothetical protein [Escherichia albertii]
PDQIITFNRHQISLMHRNKVGKGRSRNRRKSQDEHLPIAGRKKRPRHAQPKLTRKMITGITIVIYAWYRELPGEFSLVQPNPRQPPIDN